jgi:hypothetical protein
MLMGASLSLVGIDFCGTLTLGFFGMAVTRRGVEQPRAAFGVALGS